MSSTKKIFSKVKIKALPSAQLKEKLKFQATKIISKEMKIIKNLLIRKLIRKLQEERESSNSDENTENLLLALKKVDHTAIGKAITGSMSILSVNNTDQETCAAQLEAHVLQYFKSHRRTKEVIESLEKKINSSIQKNNSLRSKEQKALAKKQKLSNMIMKRRLDVKERTTAVFLDSLEDGAKVEEERNEKQKEMDKQRKLLAKKNKKLKNNDKRKRDSTESDSSRSYYTGDHTQSSNHASDNIGYPSAKKFNSGSSSGSGITNRSSSSSSNVQTNATSHPLYRASSVSRGGAPPEAALSSALVAHGGKDWKSSGIHPSWAAKQLAKKTAVVISATAPTTGKKITFEDD